MPASQINSESKMEALEIADDLADAIVAAGPGGLRYVDGAEFVGLDYDRFYLLVARLVELGRVKIELAPQGNQHRIFLPHQEAPALSMVTDKQREVLNLLCSLMDDEGFVSISFKQIAERTGCRCPSFALERLDVKGFLEVLESGRGSYANLYRVYPKGDGPRGYSWPRPVASPSR